MMALKHRPGVAACAIALLTSMTSLAQDANPSAVKARLDAVAAAYTPGNAFMGSVLVVNDDQVLLDKGYVMADVERNISNTPDTKFRLGSLTKQFTSALILLPPARWQAGDPKSSKPLFAGRAEELEKDHGSRVTGAYVGHSRFYGVEELSNLGNESAHAGRRNSLVPREATRVSAGK